MSSETVKADRNQLFGMIFLLASRWQNLGDRELKDSGITTKQWLLLVSVQALFSSPPNLNELTQAMGSSRQNIKQLALQLQRQGLLDIFSDPSDRRVQRFRLTEKNRAFWDAREDRDEQFIASLFNDLSEGALAQTHQSIRVLLQQTEGQIKG